MTVRLVIGAGSLLFCLACGGQALSSGEAEPARETGGSSSGGASTGSPGGSTATGGAPVECDLWPSGEVPIVYCPDSCGYRQCWAPEEARVEFGLPAENGVGSGAECPAAELLKDPRSQWCARTARCAVEPTEPGLCCYAVTSCIK